MRDSTTYLNDLKTAEEQVWDAQRGVWAGAGTRYFRYYTTDSGIGFVHGLRYVLDADGYARMAELGLDPADPAQVDDALLAGFAAEYYEYDGDRRPTKIARHGGAEVVGIARLKSDGHSSRNWARREIESRADGSTLATYFRQGQPPGASGPRGRGGEVGGLLGVRRRQVMFPAKLKRKFLASCLDTPIPAGSAALARHSGQDDFHRTPSDPGPSAGREPKG